MALIDSCVAYWKMDESSGDMIDAEGSNDGVVTSTTQNSDGIINTGYYFDGANDIVQVDDDASINFDENDNFSIGYWTKFNGDVGTVEVIMKRNLNVRYGFFNLAGNFAHCQMGDGSTAISISDDVDLNDGEWHLIIMSYSGSTSTLYLYVDGTEVDNTSSAALSGLATSTAKLKFGYERVGWYKGYLDEAFVFSKALDSDDVTALWNSGAGWAYPFSAATGTNMKINIGDTFKDVDSMKINIADTWKAVESVKINVGDSWKTVF